MLAAKIVQKARAAVMAVAMGTMPLATTATCDPFRGTLDFYRYDDGFHGGILDVFIEDDYYYYDDYYYDDYYYDGCGLFDCYYDDYYYAEVIIYDR